MTTSAQRSMSQLARSRCHWTNSVTWRRALGLGKASQQLQSRCHLAYLGIGAKGLNMCIHEWYIYIYIYMSPFEASSSMISLFAMILRFLSHVSLLGVSMHFIASIRFVDEDGTMVGQCLDLLCWNELNQVLHGMIWKNTARSPLSARPSFRWTVSPWMTGRSCWSALLGIVSCRAESPCILESWMWTGGPLRAALKWVVKGILKSGLDSRL